jgi:hypothetical protein
MEELLLAADPTVGRSLRRVTSISAMETESLGQRDAANGFGALGLGTAQRSAGAGLVRSAYRLETDDSAVLWRR